MVAIATLFAIALPNATDFVWLFYKVYLAMAMGYFVDLTMAWFGGESEMLQKVGDGTLIKMRTPPCCCCFCICPKPLPFTKTRIQILRGSVYQVRIIFWCCYTSIRILRWANSLACILCLNFLCRPKSLQAHFQGFSV